MNSTTLAPPKRPVEAPRHPSPPRRRASRWKHLLPRLALVLVLGAAIVAGMAQFATPAVTPATAPATQFSADRAVQQVARIALTPHPMGSAAHASTLQYLVNRLTALGLRPQISTITATLRTAPG